MQIQKVRRSLVVFRSSTTKDRLPFILPKFVAIIPEHFKYSHFHIFTVFATFLLEEDKPHRNMSSSHVPHLSYQINMLSNYARFSPLFSHYWP